MPSKLLSIAAAFAFIGLSQTRPTDQSPYGVIYTLDNDPNGASIIAVKADQDGTLSSPTMTSTGGKGLAGVTGPGQPGVGALFGSDAIVVEDDVSIRLPTTRDILIWLQSTYSPSTPVPILFQCSRSSLQILYTPF